MKNDDEGDKLASKTLRLRDFFAAAATTADIKSFMGLYPETTRQIAKYAFADAMLRERLERSSGVKDEEDEEEQT